MGLSGWSRMRRSGSEDPHICQQKFNSYNMLLIYKKIILILNLLIGQPRIGQNTLLGCVSIVEDKLSANVYLLHGLKIEPWVAIHYGHPGDAVGVELAVV